LDKNNPERGTESLKKRKKSQSWRTEDMPCIRRIFEKTFLCCGAPEGKVGRND